MRTCGKNCHHATGHRCTCWCRGVFHGPHGEWARQVTVAIAGRLPRSRDEYERMAAQAALRGIRLPGPEITQAQLFTDVMP